MESSKILEDTYQKEIIKLLQKMIQIKTVNPPGNEKPLADEEIATIEGRKK